MTDFHNTLLSLAAAQLASQKEDLKNLRNQAAVSSAVTGIIMTVFATLASEDAIILTADEIGILGVPLSMWLVISSFSISVGSSILAVTDQGDCTFDLSPKWAFTELEARGDSNQVLRKMAEAADQYHTENERVISKARGYIVSSMVFSFAQIPAWLLVIY